MGENKLSSWKMTELNGEFQLVQSSFPELKDNEVLVKVAGCGVCHTDLSFWHYGVKTKQSMDFNERIERIEKHLKLE